MFYILLSLLFAAHLFCQDPGDLEYLVHAPTLCQDPGDLEYLVHAPTQCHAPTQYLKCRNSQPESPSITPPPKAPKPAEYTLLSGAIATWHFMSPIPVQTSPEEDFYQRPLGVAIPMEDRNAGKHIFVQRIGSMHFSEKKQATVIACAAYKNEEKEGALTYVLVETSPQPQGQHLIEVSAVDAQGSTLLDTRVTTPYTREARPFLVKEILPVKPHTFIEKKVETLSYPLPTTAPTTEPWILEISTSQDNIFTLQIPGKTAKISWAFDQK